MTIWFSTNIPEMRAISAFNQVGTQISDIQQRITTGQRINSGRDDPGGLILREGLRADIKGIHGAQAGMNQAENLMNVASNGMMQLLSFIVGSDPNNPDDGGLIGAMSGSMTNTAKKAFADNFMRMYDVAINTTRFNGEQLLGGDINKTYQLGHGTGAGTLAVTIANLSSATGGAAENLATAIGLIHTGQDSTIQDVIAAARTLQTNIAGHLGTLGGNQNVIAMNQRLLDSQLTTLTAAEGRISNTDVAVESSRMARAELLAQNAMNSIMYNRRFAAFTVSSLFG